MHPSVIFAGIALPFITLAAPALQHTSKRLSNSLHSRQDNGTPSATCDLSDIKQPASALKAPNPDLSLVLIALGRGTQNYTCVSSTGTPSAIGAVATLFNASCAIASGTGTFGVIEESATSIGAHFFVDTTTPEFDINGIGNTQAKKAENVAAPNPQNDVPWLRLEAQEQGTTSQVKQIYRLNTHGGLAPSTCAGHAAGEIITVVYEAQYWIYALTETVNNLRQKRGLGLI